MLEELEAVRAPGRRPVRVVSAPVPARPPPGLPILTLTMMTVALLIVISIGALVAAHLT
jgi:hypothetical protein